MIKDFLKYFIITLAILSSILYVFSIQEGFEVLNLQGSYINNITQTFYYFAYWVLFAWWFYLIILSLCISLLILTIKKYRGGND